MGVTLRLESVRVTLARLPPGNAMAKTSPPDPAKPARQTPNRFLLGDAAACMAQRPCTR